MKREITHCLTAILLLTGQFLLGQSAILKGKILDPAGAGVAFANVVLYNAADTSMAKVEVTDNDGFFRMINMREGQYWITVSYVGFQPFRSEPFRLEGGQELEMEVINLEEANTQLDEVVVVAERPILELKADKMVFNVEGSANAVGSDALELLRKAPGVIVDNNDNITLLGKSGVQIYIDGKPSPLSSTDLAAFLKTLQSTEIDNIELITSPSSKYEAQGNAGIINIKLKKDQRLGANANINLGYNVGKVANYNSTITGNYRNRTLNAFGSYSYNDGRNVNTFNLYREQNGFFFDQRNLAGGGWNSHNFKAGTDFFINDKNTFGFLVNGYINEGHWESNSRTPIGMIGVSTIDSILVAQSVSQNDRQNLNFNLNYQFDNGEETTYNVDADYGRFRNEGRSLQPNRYYDATETEILQERINRNETPVDIDIYTFKLDQERPFLSGKLGAGLKLSYVKTDNIFDFYDILNNESILNLDRSNQFVYEERVNAGYLNYNRQLKKFGFQLGLRVEQTHSTGDLTSNQQSPEDYVERTYTDLFPSAGITYTPNQKHSLQLSYSRRINRPSYQDLNPFRQQLDELTFEKGNPFLQPEYSNSIQLTHSFNYKLNTTLSFSHTTDLITRITDIEDEKASFITWLNLADQYNYSLSLGAPIPINDWWSTYTNMTGYFTHNEADYGDGKIVDLDVYSFNIYSQQTFKIKKDLSLEVSGWYNSPSLWGGTFEMASMWSMDAGIQKKVLDGRGNIKISVSDIFKTNKWSGTSRFGGLFMDVGGSWDSRRLRVNFSYLLGNDQVKSARRRKTGLEDEQSRIKTEN